jgi:LAGLIDADG endonuclease
MKIVKKIIILLVIMVTRGTSSQWRPALRFGKSHVWVKLSNSGKVLKLMIPSYNWKIIDGWSNYSGKVISHKMIEREMGDRGSKSKLSLNRPTRDKLNFVKEQRVDGSLCLINKHIRCILMGFERNYQIKILSNQIRTFICYCKTNNNCFDADISLKQISEVINFSSSPRLGPTDQGGKDLDVAPDPTGRGATARNKLNKWFITGFSDAESSFIILVQPRSDSKTKWRIKANFSISLNKKDIEILEDIKYSLGVGRIYTSGTKVFYRVENFNELQVIVDHFDNYPLVTNKKMDYTLFKECFNIIKDKKHLTHEGLLKIVQIKSSLNRGLSENLKKLFKINIYEKLKFKFEGIPDPYWVAGFTSGDGSFNIKTTKSRLGKVQLRYAINLHIREKDVIVGLFKYLYKYKNLKEENTKYIYYTETSVAIQIVKFSDIINIIIPFFDKYSLQGQKRLDYNDFKKVSEILSRKEHLNEEGYNEILRIKKGMNLKRI